MLEKLRDNPKAVVATLIAAGVIALAAGGSSNTEDSADTDKQNEVTTSETAEEHSDDSMEETSMEESMEAKTEDTAIGSEPDAGEVMVKKEGEVLSSTLRAGDSQTVVVRQMVNEYLSANDMKLSSVQRLYIETNVVDMIPRNETVLIGDVVTVEESMISQYVESSKALTGTETTLWERYL